MPDLVGAQVSDVDKLVVDEGTVGMRCLLPVRIHVTAGTKVLAEVPSLDFTLRHRIFFIRVSTYAGGLVVRGEVS